MRIFRFQNILSFHCMPPDQNCFNNFFQSYGLIDPFSKICFKEIIINFSMYCFFCCCCFTIRIIKLP